MGIPIHLIVAICSNNGIGYKGTLPWSLKKELQHFNRLTKEVKNPEKKNAVIMGRKTWDSLPEKWQPLPDRLNFVISTQSLEFKGAVSCSDVEDAVAKINAPDYADQIETAWVIGGSKIYESALEKNLCDKVFLTRIMKNFECDTFLDYDFSKKFKEIRDERVPKNIQEENNIQYVFYVYEKDLLGLTNGNTNQSNNLPK